MRKPVAIITKEKPKKAKSKRIPKAFAPSKKAQEIISFVEEQDKIIVSPTPTNKKNHWLRNILLGAISLLLSLAIALNLEQLVRDLFARSEWLGSIGLGAVILLVLTLIILIIREVFALSRLSHLDETRASAANILVTDNKEDANKIITELLSIYSSNADLAKARQELEIQSKSMFDGSDIINLAERKLMSPLDIKAKALTSASARRVAIVTAISPRALVDIAFVTYESFKLTRSIANLYGARSGLFGSLKIGSAILSHLAVTGGVALGDSVVQQLLGHGMAAKLSARLGEGLVNGLMSVRVGIAAMRVVRPLPFETQKQPVVMDFMADLVKITKSSTE